MSNADLAYVTPKLVAWAIKQSRLSYEEIQKTLKVELGEIVAWEKGKSHPPFEKAEELATLLNIPFGYLFLDDAPETNIPLPDLRTLSGKPINPSAEFRSVLNSVLYRQEWYREYALDRGLKDVPFVSSMSQDAGVNAIATSIRQALGIGIDLRESVKTWGAYLTLLTSQAETLGILVMRSGLVGNDTRHKLSPTEFQGFAISDPIAPIVFINGRDFLRAQIFTLAHELTHLWIGQSGVCTSDEAHVKREQQVEEFCDAVAAEVLVPKAEFVNDWALEPDISKLAKKYWVSTFVTLRRAYETKRLTREEFLTLYKQEAAKRSAVKRGKGGKYYESVATRHSRRLAKAVVKDVHEGGTVFRDGARLLHLKVATFSKFMERV
jgi:Zn-dependent peptidase ImmA (M78 family)